MQETYRKLNTLLYYRWRKAWKFYFVLFSLFILSCSFLLYQKGTTLGWVRYEVYYGQRSCVILFFITLILCVAYSLFSLLHMQRDVNQMHRYLILPHARFTIVISNVCMNICAIALLLMIHYFIYYFGFRYYVSFASFYDIANGFILSIARSEFLRYLFPLTIPQWLILLSSIVMLATIPVYLGVFHHDIMRCFIGGLMMMIIVYVWVFPAGLEMDFMRIVQMCLLISMLFLLYIDIRKAITNNVAGGV